MHDRSHKGILARPPKEVILGSTSPRARPFNSRPQRPRPKAVSSPLKLPTEGGNGILPLLAALVFTVLFSLPLHPRNNRSADHPAPSPVRPLQAPQGIRVAALVVIAVMALAALWPLSHGGHSEAREPDGLPVLIIADGLSFAIRSHAETVVSALAEAGVTAAAEDTILREGAQVLPGSALLPPPLMVAAGRVAARGALAAPTDPTPFMLQLRRAVPIFLHEEGLTASFVSSKYTVGDALAAKGVEIGPGDRVVPAPDTLLSAGLHIYVTHFDEVFLTVGGKERTVYTRTNSVAQLLAEQGIRLGPRDEVRPSLGAAVREGMAVRVVVVREKTEAVEEVIPKRTLYRDDPTLELGQSYVLEPGADGKVIRTYRVVYRDGEAKSRHLLSETVQPAESRIVVRGTKVNGHQLALSDGTTLKFSRTMLVWATWYNANCPGCDNITATGAILQKGIVAVDPRVIPLGTRMYIPGYGFGIAADTGGGIIGNMIDLAYAENWRTGWVEIYILD